MRKPKHRLSGSAPRKPTGESVLANRPAEKASGPAVLQFPYSEAEPVTAEALKALRDAKARERLRLSRAKQ